MFAETLGPGGEPKNLTVARWDHFMTHFHNLAEVPMFIGVFNTNPLKTTSQYLEYLYSIKTGFLFLCGIALELCKFAQKHLVSVY